VRCTHAAAGTGGPVARGLSYGVDICNFIVRFVSRRRRRPCRQRVLALAHRL